MVSFRTFLLWVGSIGALISVLVYLSCLFSCLPGFPDLHFIPWNAPGNALTASLHVLAIVNFASSFLLFHHRLRNSPPPIRARGFHFLVTLAPVPLRILILLVIVLAAANFLMNGPVMSALCDSDLSEPAAHCHELGLFVPHWILFFLGSVHLCWPGSDAQEKSPGPEEHQSSRFGPLVHRSSTSKPPMETRASYRIHQRPGQIRRILSGGFAFALGSTALPAIGMLPLAYFTESYFYIAMALLFAVVTTLNFRFRKKQCRYHLVSIHFGQEVVLEYMDGNEIQRLSEPPSAIGAEWREEVIRGNSIFYLNIYRTASDERSVLRGDEYSNEDGSILRQQANQYWPYETLDAIHRRLNLNG